MKILVSEDGYKQYLDLVKEIDLKLDNISLDQSEGFKSTGDGWHDNFAFEEAAREEIRLSKLYSDLVKNKEFIEVINDKYHKNKVNINDVIKIRFDEDDYEIIKLTGKYMPDNMADIQEVTLNSEIGKNIYNKKIGSKVNYFVNENKISFEIVERIN